MVMLCVRVRLRLSLRLSRSSSGRSSHHDGACWVLLIEAYIQYTCLPIKAVVGFWDGRQKGQRGRRR
jgi:hypothetical protein